MASAHFRQAGRSDLRYKAGALTLRHARPHRHWGSRSGPFDGSPANRVGGLRLERLRPVIVAGSLLGALPACEGWTWSEEGPKKPADGRLLVVEVIGTQTCSPETQATEPMPPLLGVEVEVVGWAEAGVPANYFYARLEDEDGERYPAREGCEPLLMGPPLRPGERARGFVSFSVPARRGGLKLVYEPRLVQDGGRTEPVRFEVALESQEGI